MALTLLLAASPLGVIRASHAPSHYLVSQAGGSYIAASSARTFSGTLKSVVESAIADLDAMGGGRLTFSAGTFDLGSGYFRLTNIADIVIEGQGIDVTIVRNSSTASADTEPFNTQNTLRVTIRDLTVIAGGPARTTSDAIDFDQGNYNIVERVKISGSRGKGIIFDGKNSGWNAIGNTVRDCEISGTSNDGVQFLASSENRVEGCYIHDVGGDGIEATKSSSQASQAHKKSNDNVIEGNTVTNAGENGIRVNSSDRNVIRANVVMNSSDDRSGRDGIRIASADSKTCNDNRVEGNRAGDDQVTKTQTYGLYITSSLCSRTFVADNDFSGNKTAGIRDLGTGTIYGSQDGTPPSAPTNLAATPISSSRVDLAWTASTDNVGVTAYSIERNGQPLITLGGTITSYSDQGVLPETSYTYVVRARDAAGNVSGPSNQANATTPPGPPILTITPSDDTYVRADQPTANFGSATTIQVDGSPLKRMLIKFTVSGVAGRAVTGVKLRLKVVDSSDVGGVFHRVTDVTSWSEGTATWGTVVPYEATSFGAIGSVQVGNWVELSMPFVTGDGTFSIIALSASANGADFVSTEGIDPPQVVVTLQ